MKLLWAHAWGIFSLRFVGSKIPPRRKFLRIHPRTYGSARLTILSLSKDVRDVKETLAGRGFETEPFKIVEVCNAQSAYAVLKAGFFPNVDLGDLPKKVDQVITAFKKTTGRARG